MADSAARPSAGLVAVESVFGAGTMLAPMPGARLLRFVGRLQDPWSGGLHLDHEPADADERRSWLSSWDAFERPGRLRWTVAPGTSLDDVRDDLGDDLMVAARPVLRTTEAAAVPASPPDGVTVAPITADVRDWAGFEVLARWVDLDEDPAVWRWRASRVRHLVEAGRGSAWLARTPSAPVGAVVRLRAPEHHGGEAPDAMVVVVHQAHRRRGIARALLSTALAARTGPVVVLGDGAGHLVEAGRHLGLAHVHDLVEVGTRPSPSDRKA